MIMRMNIAWVKEVPVPVGELDMFMSAVRAGFPSPADDFVERGLDLNDFLVSHPAATFFARVQGQAMAAEGIYDGDYLVVDRSVVPSPNSLVMAVMPDGEIGLKRMKGKEPQELWGVVTSVIRKV
jgi:DNA polymerase V